MRVTKTKDEMLAYVRLMQGLEPLRADCSVEYTDGIDVNAVLEQKIRARYLDLLRTAPRALLAEDDLADECSSLPVYPPGGTRVVLPAVCVRVFDICMAGWRKAVPVQDPELKDIIVRRQKNPFTAATAESPVAVMNGDDPHSVLVFPGGEAVTTLSCVADYGPARYAFDDAALNQFHNIFYG